MGGSSWSGGSFGGFSGGGGSRPAAAAAGDPQIESSSNARSFGDRAKKGGRRTGTGRFIIEGARRRHSRSLPVPRLPRSSVAGVAGTVETQTLAEDMAETGIQITTTSARAFDKLSMRQHPDGMVAVAPGGISSLVKWGKVSTLVAESIEKPGNLEPCPHGRCGRRRSADRRSERRPF